MAMAAHSFGGGGGGTAAGRGGSSRLGRCQSSTAPRNSRSRSAALDFRPLLAAASLLRTSSVLPAMTSDPSRVSTTCHDARPHSFYISRCKTAEINNVTAGCQAPGVLLLHKKLHI